MNVINRDIGTTIVQFPNDVAILFSNNKPVVVYLPRRGYFVTAGELSSLDQARIDCYLPKDHIPYLSPQRVIDRIADHVTVNSDVVESILTKGA